MAKGKKKKAGKKAKKAKKSLVTAKKKIREEICEEIRREVGEEGQEVGEEVRQKIRQKIEGSRAEEIRQEIRQEGRCQEEPCKEEGAPSPLHRSPLRLRPSRPRLPRPPRRPELGHPQPCAVMGSFGREFEARPPLAETTATSRARSPIRAHPGGHIFRGRSVRRCGLFISGNPCDCDSKICGPDPATVAKMPPARRKNRSNLLSECNTR